MPSRTSTPAGRRRVAAGTATRPARKAPSAPKRPAAKRPAAKRPATKRPVAKRAAPKRAAAKRPAAKRTPPGRPALRYGLIALVVVGALVAGYFGWFRDSSLVGIRNVQVSGVSSPDAGRIEAALTEAAKSMTTLNLQEDKLDAAVTGFPTVISVSADADLPNGLEVTVKERPPALMVEARGETLPAAGDGMILRGLEMGDAAKALPALTLDELPPSGRLGGEALEQAGILGAAPPELRPLIEKVAFERDHGVVVILRGEIPVRFGSKAAAAEKWTAAATVLADPKLETLTYVDVRLPERPAVGGAAPVTAQEDPAAAEEAVAPTDDELASPAL